MAINKPSMNQSNTINNKDFIPGKLNENNKYYRIVKSKVSYTLTSIKKLIIEIVMWIVENYKKYTALRLLKNIKGFVENSFKSTFSDKVEKYNEIDRSLLSIPGTQESVFVEKYDESDGIVKNLTAEEGEALADVMERSSNPIFFTDLKVSDSNLGSSYLYEIGDSKLLFRPITNVKGEKSGLVNGQKMLQNHIKIKKFVNQIEHSSSVNVVDREFVYPDNRSIVENSQVAGLILQEKENDNTSVDILDIDNFSEEKVSEIACAFIEISNEYTFYKEGEAQEILERFFNKEALNREFALAYYDMISGFKDFIGIIDETTKLSLLIKETANIEEKSKHKKINGRNTTDLRRMVKSPRRKTPGYLSRETSEVKRSESTLTNGQELSDGVSLNDQFESILPYIQAFFVFGGQSRIMLEYIENNLNHKLTDRQKDFLILCSDFGLS